MLTESTVQSHRQCECGCQQRRYYRAVVNGPECDLVQRIDLVAFITGRWGKAFALMCVGVLLSCGPPLLESVHDDPNAGFSRMWDSYGRNILLLLLICLTVWTLLGAACFTWRRWSFTHRAEHTCVGRDGQVLWISVLGCPAGTGFWRIMLDRPDEDIISTAALLWPRPAALALLEDYDTLIQLNSIAAKHGVEKREVPALLQRSETIRQRIISQCRAVCTPNDAQMAALAEARRKRLRQPAVDAATADVTALLRQQTPQAIQAPHPHQQ